MMATITYYSALTVLCVLSTPGFHSKKLNNLLVMVDVLTAGNTGLIFNTLLYLFTFVLC